MLTLDITKLSEQQLIAAVTCHCAGFGTVKHVKIMPPADHRKYALAAVEMGDVVEAEKLRVKSGDSKIGATVIIRLMDERRARAFADEWVEDEQEARAQTRPANILLIEDDPADVRMTREALAAAGIRHQLHVVADGMEAISFLHKTRQFNAAPEPDIVLVDLNLPKVNGHEVLREIKSSDQLKHIPVVVLTSSKAHRDVTRSYECEADWFVSKPTGLDAYAAAMKRVETLIAH